MSRWQGSSKIHYVLAIAMVTMVIMLSPSVVVVGCPAVCQCPQPYYVYCQRIGLKSEDVLEVVSAIPYEAILLDLSSNVVDELTSGVFDLLYNLEYLLLDNNRVHKLGLSVFHYLQRLKELNLRKNRLQEIGSGVFINMSGLKKLHLDGNEIEKIDDRAFSLPSLSHLYLQKNKLTLLRPSQLGNLPALQHLDLSDNLIQSLDLGAFQDLTRLQKLWLSRNRLSTLAENVFQGLTSLRELYLDGNMLPSLDCFDVPNFANTLQHLMLTDNSLVAVPHDVFSKLQNLRTLALDHNQISHVGQQAFRGLQLDNLTLAHNYLQVIDRSMLDKMRRIATLDLSHNRIHTIKTGAFDSFRESVYVLNLAGNNLGTLDHGMFRGMRNLQTLNLSSNSIWSILDGSFRELTQLVTLDLDHNELQWLSAGLLEGPSLQWLSVLDNPIRELRGFTFEDASHPVSVFVNLTLQSSTMDSVTVTWPYRQGMQLYWKLQAWCVPESEGGPHCDTPFVESSIPPNKVSHTITGLQPGREYFVCVNPTFLSKEVKVLQCGVVTTQRHPTTTVELENRESQTSNGGLALKGASAAVCVCGVVAVLMVNLLCPFFWMDAMLLMLWTRTRWFLLLNYVSV